MDWNNDPIKQYSYSVIIIKRLKKWFKIEKDSIYKTNPQMEF